MFAPGMVVRNLRNRVALLDDESERVVPVDPPAHYRFAAGASIVFGTDMDGIVRMLQA